MHKITAEFHNIDGMSEMVSQITNVPVVYSTVCSGTD